MSPAMGQSVALMLGIMCAVLTAYGVLRVHMGDKDAKSLVLAAAIGAQVWFALYILFRVLDWMLTN